MSQTGRQRLYAGLLALGASILLLQTILLQIQGAMDWMVAWVAGSLVVEQIVDVATIAGSIRWGVSGSPAHASLPLRFGAAAAIVHALRVLVYVLGDVGPWYDFDIRAEYLATHGGRVDWFWIWFASILSVLGVVGVIVIWRIRASVAKGD